MGSQMSNFALPSNLDAEEALLGAILLDPSSFATVTGDVKGEDFFLKEHRNIWFAINKLYQRNDKIDEITVAKELDVINGVQGSGWRDFLAKLIKRTPKSENYDTYAKLVSSAATRRNLLESAEEIRKLATDEEIDVSDVVSSAESSVISVKPSLSKTRMSSLGEALASYYDVMERMVANDDRIVGVPTGYDELDHLLGGFQKTDYIICAGRTGIGKTSWLLSTGLNVARAGHPVVIFTLEMSAMQLVQRLVAVESGLSATQLRRGALNSSEMTRFAEALSNLSSLPIYIDDSPDLSPPTMFMRCRRLQDKDPLSLIIVDYIQLMSLSNKAVGNREREVAEVSRGLKRMAGDLDVTVLAAAQLSREPEKRTDKRPILSDLRESGSLEQDADAVLFLYRDDYYTREESQYPGMVELDLAKHRHGPTGVAHLWFNHETTKFESSGRGDISI